MSAADRFHPEPSPGSANAWWDANATAGEKEAYEWIRENAPMAAPIQFDHNGQVVRPGTSLPQWRYLQKYPKHLPRTARALGIKSKRGKT